MSYITTFNPNSSMTGFFITLLLTDTKKKMCILCENYPGNVIIVLGTDEITSIIACARTET